MIPEDQSALWPREGDDRCVDVSGMTITTIRTVCTHIPALGSASVTITTGQYHNYMLKLGECGGSSVLLARDNRHIYSHSNVAEKVI